MELVPEPNKTRIEAARSAADDSPSLSLSLSLSLYIYILIPTGKSSEAIIIFILLPPPLPVPLVSLVYNNSRNKRFEELTPYVKSCFSLKTCVENKIGTFLK